ncbi:hypothetical protein [Streptomyces sp. NPDC086989]
MSAGGRQRVLRAAGARTLVQVSRGSVHDPRRDRGLVGEGGPRGGRSDA